jgi:uncharacterized protein Yka (UPF0111/DUF47 family)
MFPGRDGKFFDPLRRQMDLLTEASRLVLECARENRNARTDAGPRIEQLLEESIRLEAGLVDRLTHCLLTPLDPEDLLALATQMRKALSSVAGAASRLEFCPCQPAPAELVEELQLLHECARTLTSAFSSIRNGAMARQCDEARALRARADRIGRDARIKLFAAAGEPLQVLRLRETFDLTETVLGRCVAVGETLKRIKLKNA